MSLIREIVREELAAMLGGRERRSPGRPRSASAEVLRALAGGQGRVVDVAKHLGRDPGSTGTLMALMAKRGELRRVGRGVYALPGRLARRRRAA